MNRHWAPLLVAAMLALPATGISQTFASTKMLWCRAPLPVAIAGKIFAYFDKNPSAAGPNGNALTTPGTCAWEASPVAAGEPNQIELYTLTATDRRAADMLVANVELRALAFHLVMTPDVILKGNALIGFAIDAISGPYTGWYGPAGKFSGNMYFRPIGTGISMIVVP